MYITSCPPDSKHGQDWVNVFDVLGVAGTPTYETLKDRKYGTNVLNETLRLHPAVPLNMRQALQTTMISGAPGEPDIVLLNGDTVTIHTLGIHGRRNLYLVVSDQFADPAVFIPICVGQNFALTEMAFCLVRVAQRFERTEYRDE
ncbi:cytochrome p450 [Hirsutella rhossiliensis]|uniref:Cytochrome p450 domain-containing protein n=1 Tax=Hirsutella rhossiliensis TaxID=111463 RepID=A0A9P8MT27_9HYPO|nr:cytochrome p450 domain-containing protein [Hirsutella rhossiliensis]KAH0960720.1 cytochrome p450 domain-containing protein [Hirsutella rhossiliensis]